MPADPPRWHVVLPVKQLGRAKTRLAWPPERRAELAEAMALDVAQAVRQARAVTHAAVVTADPRIRAQLTVLGFDVVDDPGRGLGAAIDAGVDYWRRRDEDAAVAVLTADLPCLSATQLDEALSVSAGVPAAFVPDRVGTGTTMLAAVDRTRLLPRFGPGSAAAHRATGAVPVGEHLPGLRLDVDSLDDLELVTRVPWVDSLGANTAASVTRVAKLD